MAFQQRQTAYKVFISDLLNNEYVIQSGEWDPNYITVGDKKVSRSNIIATVIDKHDTELISSATLDDGTGSIQTRCFNENIKILKDIQVGDLVLVVGRPRENNNKERFIVTEIARKLDKPLWAEVRKLELQKLGLTPGKREEVKTENKGAIEEQVVDDTGKKVIDLIRSNDDGGGANTDDVISKSEMNDEETRKVIKKLLEQGEIYENRPNRLKNIE